MFLQIALPLLLFVSLSVAGCGGGSNGGSDGSNPAGEAGLLSLVAGSTYPGDAAEAGTFVVSGTRTPIDARSRLSDAGPVAALADGSAIVRTRALSIRLVDGSYVSSELARVERSGDVTPLSGFGGQTDCGFWCIRDTAVTLAAHPAGKAYVYDEARGTVTVIGAAGVERTFPLLGMRSDSPLAVDGADNLYFFGDAGLVRRRPDGRTEVISADPSLGRSALAVDAQGNVYAASSFVHRISPGGTVQQLNVDPPLRSVRAMSVAPGGSLYVADYTDFVVRRISPGGDAPNIVGVAGRLGFRLGSLPGGLSSPSGVAVAADGLWVTSNQAVLFAQFPSASAGTPGVVEMGTLR